MDKAVSTERDDFAEIEAELKKLGMAIDRDRYKGLLAEMEVSAFPHWAALRVHYGLFEAAVRKAEEGGLQRSKAIVQVVGQAPRLYDDWIRWFNVGPRIRKNLRRAGVKLPE